MPTKLEHDAMIRKLREIRIQIKAFELGRLLNSNQLSEINTVEVMVFFSVWHLTKLIKTVPLKPSPNSNVPMPT